MAREAQRAAQAAELEGCPRSAASRYYYAAYQAATALLLYCGLAPPGDSEAWSHARTPEILRDQLRPLVPARTKRNDLFSRLSALYKLRVQADYEARRPFPEAASQDAKKHADIILKTLDSLFPER